MSRVTREEVIAIVGRLGDDKIAKIEETGASADEVMEAHTWLTEDDYMGHGLQRRLLGRVAAVFDILKAVEPELEEREHSG